MKKIILISIGFLVLVVAGSALAHQPRLVSDEKLIQVENPEVSQAFYGELKGEPVYYQIEAEENFSLYVGILSPQIEGADKDFSVEVNKEGEIIFLLDGLSHQWESFYEEFGGDYYYQGPDNKISAEAGLYTLKVFSPDNQGKYVLVVGEKEEFPLNEIIKTVKTLPKLKKDFFEKSPWGAFFNRIGLFLSIPILILITLVTIIILVFKRIKRKKSN